METPAAPMQRMRIPPPTTPASSTSTSSPAFTWPSSRAPAAALSRSGAALRALSRRPTSASARSSSERHLQDARVRSCLPGRSHILNFVTRTGATQVDPSQKHEPHKW
jgi:hypothetical protein